MGKFVDLTGKRYGRLVFEGRDFSPNPGKSPAFRWFVRCDCGVRKTVTAVTVTRGMSKSCGCLNREYHGGNRKHGMARTPTYVSWQAMLQRCLDPNSVSYPRYGGRGIGVPTRWKVFTNFFQDMGERPSPDHSLERLDNSKDYGPQNCVWANSREQARNRRSNIWVLFDGKKYILKDLASKLSLDYKKVHYLFRKGRLSEIIPGAYLEKKTHLDTAWGEQRLALQCLQVWRCTYAAQQRDDLGSGSWNP